MPEETIRFMDYSINRLIDIPLSRVTKRIGHAMYGGKTTYEFVGITEDGRTLVKVCGKGYWDLIEMPEPVQPQQYRLFE